MLAENRDFRIAQMERPSGLNSIMSLLRNTFITALLTFLASCSSSASFTPLLRAEPEIGAALTRAPRTLRLFYSALPDVSQSNLRLVGPNGEHALRGLHTMAADDLMIEILDPVTPGTYTVYWTTVVENDPKHHEGSFQFSYSE